MSGSKSGANEGDDDDGEDEPGDLGHTLTRHFLLPSPQHPVVPSQANNSLNLVADLAGAPSLSTAPVARVVMA
ncbi:hypothetical protein SUGI_0897000 [Cryptomeria japonica]|nr:hypothetical protein SUGI_0897000 [Cryptomeria japonica]